MRTKTCARCGKERPTSQFYKRKQLKDGLSSYCKDCWKEVNEERKREMYKQQAQYRQKNKAQRKKLRDDYYSKFKDRILARKRKTYHEQKRQQDVALSQKQN